MSINTTLSLTDGMSRVVREVASSMQILTRSIHDTDTALDKSIIGDIDTRLDSAVAEVDSIAEAFRESEERAENFGNTSNNEFNRLIGSAKKVAVAITGIWTGIKSAESLIKISDNLTQTTARLDLINDGLITTEELIENIFESASRSRGAFFDTANAVASIGQRSGNVFKNTNEIIGFVENLNKMFTIAGATQAEMSSATLQLTQALGSGVLRGEELNAVFEAAPNIIQKIADYIDVDIGQIRNLASEGKITSDIIRNAILGATDSINEEFEKMPLTYSQIWTEFKNNALQAFQPVISKIGEIANSKGFQSFVNGVSNSISILSNVIIGVIDTIEYTTEALSFAQPLIYGLVVALGAYVAILTMYNIQQSIANGLQSISNLRASVSAASLMLQSGATFSATVAQYGFNAALYACPLTWIIVAIIAVIAIFYTLIGVINKTQGTTISATGVIVGIIMASCASIWNVIADIANFIGNVFNDPIGSVIRLFVGMGDNILGILETIAKGIDAVFGSNLAGVISTWRAGVKNFVEEKFGTGKIFMEKLDISETFKIGHDWTKSKMDSFKNNKDEIGFEGINGLGDFTGSIPDISSNISNIDNNTASINKSLDSMGEDVKFIKDISERKYINDYSRNVEQKFYLYYTSKGNEEDSKKMLEIIKAEIQNDIEKNPEGVYL